MLWTSGVQPWTSEDWEDTQNLIYISGLSVSQVRNETWNILHLDTSLGQFALQLSLRLLKLPARQRKHEFLFFKAQASWAHLHSANPSHNTWAEFWKENVTPVLMNPILNIWVCFAVHFIDTFIYLLLEDVPKSTFPSGNRHRKSRKKKGKVLPLHRLFSQPVFCKKLPGIKKCTQGLRPLQATEELGAWGCRNQRFLSRNLKEWQYFSSFLCFIAFQLLWQSHLPTATGHLYQWLISASLPTFWGNLASWTEYLLLFYVTTKLSLNICVCWTPHTWPSSFIGV